jgi:hypothetical protein
VTVRARDQSALGATGCARPRQCRRQVGQKLPRALEGRQRAPEARPLLQVGKEVANGERTNRAARHHCRPTLSMSRCAGR